ncbi:peptide chain release factor 1 [Hyphococcus luteus]|uniref:Peptide chain release factor 1 n=1 Tax=Hyphococcus luteus TaxID=2058213 RepID=A0A2S7K1W1_9PROT|nr:peptide chain release factor 1 [Marinicaulis flavus]PQA86487.1 peptide chain release factor 1 [Marinicaulis flavus]
MIPQEKLDALIAKFEKLETAMSTASEADEIVRLSKEHGELKEVVEKARALTSIRTQIAELKELSESDDKDMADMAYEELQELKEKEPGVEHDLQLMLLPKDKADNSSVILEVRAGTGGDEAAIFAGDLFRMYQRYAQLQGWKVDILSASETERGGYKEIQANISGDSVYAKMKFESGVHRVQRVPETETQGRVHTSAATVAVLPEPEEVDIEINDADLRIDVFRASGPGGQSVNTTDSAVRITHIPTGVVVIQQDEKSQHKNKAKAMKVLRARLYEAERERATAERAAARKGMVGSGDRSERIRTYNFPQSRVTDHRIGLTVHNLDEIIRGDGLDSVIEELRAQDRADRLAAIQEDA